MADGPGRGGPASPPSRAGTRPAVLPRCSPRPSPEISPPGPGPCLPEGTGLRGAAPFRFAAAWPAPGAAGGARRGAGVPLGARGGRWPQHAPSLAAETAAPWRGPGAPSGAPFSHAVLCGVCPGARERRIS